jgi:hypothetical protein
MPPTRFPEMVSLFVRFRAAKENAVLHWKIKPALVVALVSLLAVVGGFIGHGHGKCGFYW